jgi:hypothetical protein
MQAAGRFLFTLIYTYCQTSEVSMTIRAQIVVFRVKVPEEGGNKFLRSFGKHLQDYIHAVKPRRPQSEIVIDSDY